MRPGVFLAGVRLVFLCWALALPLPIRAQEPAPVLAPQVLRRLPHDPGAFTQGLLFHQGAFYESTGLYGQSGLRRVDPDTGRVLARTELPAQFFGEGLALCPEGPEGRLVQLTWREGVILTYDIKTLRPTGRQPLRGQGWGLACQGSELVLSDGTQTLRWLDAKSLAETGRTLVVREGRKPLRELNELEWVGGWLLANVWQTDRVAVIHPATGQVAAWLDLAPLRRELAKEAETANGIAFDATGDGGSGQLYVTGKRWDKMFALALPELLRHSPR